jgi:hypothetical protein
MSLKDIVDLNAYFTRFRFALFGLSAQPPGDAQNEDYQQAQKDEKLAHGYLPLDTEFRRWIAKAPQQL